MASTIIGKRLAMWKKGGPAARAEFAEAVREKAVLGGMIANPFMWNPMGAAMIGGYTAGKMATNYARLTGPAAGSMYGAGYR